MGKRRRWNFISLPDPEDKRRNVRQEAFEKSLYTIWFLKGDLFLFTFYTENRFLHYLKLCLNGNGADDRWAMEIEKLGHMVKHRTAILQKEWMKGIMKMDKDLFIFFRKEIKGFREIDIERLESQVGVPQDFGITELKEQIVKGNRANFKMMQEVIQQIEKLSAEFSDYAQQKTIEDQADQLKEAIKDYTNTLLDMFDFIDLIRISVEQKGDRVWLQSVEQIVRKALDLLNMHGLEALEVKGELFDSAVMEGIGTISPQEISQDLPKYTVYAVTQRGFRLKETQQLVRRAKVITVY